MRRNKKYSRVWFDPQTMQAVVSEFQSIVKEPGETAFRTLSISNKDDDWGFDTLEEFLAELRGDCDYARVWMTNPELSLTISMWSPRDCKGCGASTCIFGVLAFIVSIIAMFYVSTELNIPTGWRTWVVVIPALVLGSIGGTIGAEIGNALRKVACPDAIFTSGGMSDILYQRIFWAVGPQLIGTSNRK